MLNAIACAALLSSLGFAASTDTWSKVKSEVEAQFEKLSDGQVLGALTALNDSELDAARLARGRALDPQVKGFAEHMIADHSASNDQVSFLARRLNISPQTSSASAALTQTGKAESDVLSSLNGAAFDKAYIDRQVADHQSGLDLINRTLLPSASSEDLKTVLNRTRDIVTQHLAAAKTIQAQLAGSR